MSRGLFITFEGVDGCGKSTQLRFASEHLAARGEDFLFTREPGGCPVAEKIREMLLDVENSGMSAYTEALLYAAARVQHVDEVILPALEAGKIVLCDRYIDSSVAYQGFGRQISAETVWQINGYAARRCMPDHTIFLDVPPDAAFGRMNPAKQHDRLEQEDSAFFARVYEGFDTLCAQFPQRIVRVDVSGTKFETRDKLCAILDGLLDAR